jgi:flagellar motor switch protein FliN/FliY
MGDMLSQEEINALLTGGSNDSSDDDLEAMEALGSLGALEDEDDFEAMLKGATDYVPEGSDASVEVSDDNNSGGGNESDEPNNVDDSRFIDVLTPEQMDALGEIGNISMGTAATTLFTLLNEKVLITTPKVTVSDWPTLGKSYDRPCVGIKVNYTEGLEGSNVLILKERDVKIIASLMMQADGVVEEPIELNELDLSAIGEAMNQMVGSSSTSLSSVINRKIDIGTPEAFILDFNDDSFFEAVGQPPDEVITCIAFKMEIGTLIDSEIMQIVPVDFAKDVVDKMMANMMGGGSAPAAAPEPAVAAAPVPEAPVAPAAMPPMAAPAQMMPQTPMAGVPQMMYQQPVYPQSGAVIPGMASVNAQPAQFQTLDITDLAQQKENIGIIMDVPLEVTVELGRTSRKIKEILEFAPGTIVDLDKLAGEPIDILVNGKHVATGEVVVVDENFAVRVTDIISVDKRI